MPSLACHALPHTPLSPGSPPITHATLLYNPPLHRLERRRVLQQHLRARARTPLGLAPVGSAAVIRPGTAKVASTAAQSRGTLGVDNGAASLAVLGDLGGGSRGGWGFLGEGAIAEAGLAAGSTVEGLVLDLK